jgi:hypothetical protein
VTGPHRSAALALVVILALARGARADDEPARASDAPEEHPPTRPPRPRDAEMKELKDELAELRRHQAELEARVAAQEKTEQKRPLVLVSGFAHVDWTLLRQSSEDEVDSAGKPLNERRFLLRRGRIRAESDQGYVHGAVMVDANTIDGPQMRPWNVEATVKWPASRPYSMEPIAAARDHGPDPYFMVTAGLILTPFGHELQELDITRTWLERSTMSGALFPTPYDLGLRVLGGYRIVQWELGIMNGDPLGEKTFPGRDPNKSKDLVFRLGAGGDLGSIVRIEGGVSGLTGRGFHEGTQGTKDQLVWRDQNENGVVEAPELQVAPGSPATPSESFDRFALGADLRVRAQLPVLGLLEARAELVRAKNLDRGLVIADPVSASRDLRESGFHVGVTQEITRWAALGVRYDLYDPDSDASEQRAFALVPRDSTFKTWAFAAIFRLPSALRVIAEYDLKKNALGRDVSGNPTTLADDSFTVRAEVKF